MPITTESCKMAFYGLTEKKTQRNKFYLSDFAHFRAESGFGC